jgi:hypothetical protein
MDRKYDVIFMTLGGRTILGHSGKASTMGKPTGDDLRYRTAIFGFSILEESMAVARAKMTFPDGASWPNAGHPVNKKPLCRKVNRWD